jgi:uncharacterized membrane protein
MKTRIVPASHGWLWIKQAFGLFRQSPLIWITLSISVILIGATLGMIPFLGSVLFQLIAPGLTAGLLLGCRAQQQGEELEIAHLFAGFKSHGAQLVTVGGIYLTGMLIIAAIVGMIGGEPLIRALTAGHPSADTVATTGMAGMNMMPVLVGLALLIPLLMAYWFAPALVVFGNMRPVDALKTSLAASLNNVTAFLIYGLSIFLLFILATLPIMLGFLIMIPIAFISYYTAFEDVFGDDAVSQISKTV